MRIKVLRSNPPVLRCWIRRYWFKRVIGGCMEGWWQWLACTSGLPIAQRTKCNRLSSSQILEMMLNRVKKHTRCDLLQFAQELAQTICQARSGKPHFWNVLVLYRHCPNSFRASPLCQTGKRGKKCPKPPWQALTPPGNMGKKSASNHPGKPLQPRAMWEKSAPNHPGKAFQFTPPAPPYGQCPYRNNTFQKGASLIFCCNSYL